MYKNILVAIDGSAHTLKVIDHVIAFAKQSFVDNITLLHVVNENELGSVAFRTEESMLNDPKVDTALAPALQLLNEANVSYALVKKLEHPAQTIIQYCEEQAIDLLFIGSRGLNPIEKLVLGSVSQKVVNEVACPVFLVK